MPTRNTRLKCLLLLFILCLSIPLTGCWDDREVEQLAVMNTIGIDLLPNGEWQVSVLLLNPFSKGSEASPQGERNPNILMKGTGKTIGEAINDFSKRMSRIDFWGSMENLIIGEAAAKQHVVDIIKIHLRHPEVRPRTNILVTPGEAFEVLQTNPDASINLSREIKLLTELSIDKFGNSYGVNIAEFAENLLCPDRDPVAPLIHILEPEEGKTDKSPERTIFLEGLAVFRGDELIGTLNKEQSLSYLITARDVRRAKAAIDLEEGGKRYYFLLDSSKSKIKPQVDGEKISYRLSIKVYGSLVDDNGLPLTLDNIEHIEKQVSDKLLSQVLEVIKIAKGHKADFLGFTKALHRHEPKAWQKISATWRESFEEAPIEVSVETSIKSTGRISPPFDAK